MLAQIRLVLFMLGMGATLSPRDFAPVFRQPRDLIYGVTFELLLTPLIAVGVNLVADVGAGIAMGILLMGVMPGGTLSNVFTYVSRGNVALSIALTAVATLLALFTIPFTLDLLAGDFVPPDFEMPVLGIVREIVLCVLVPWDWACCWPASPLAPRVHFQRLHGARLYSSPSWILGSLGSGRVQPARYHWSVLLTIIAFCVFCQQLSMLPRSCCAGRWASWVAIGIEATIRNVYLALLLTTLLFPAGEETTGSLGADVLFVVLAYGMVSLAAVCPLTIRIRRKLRPGFRAGVTGAAAEGAKRSP